MRKTSNSPRLHWSSLTTLSILAVLALLVTFISLQDNVTRLRIIREGSWIELTSAILWFGVAGLYITTTWRGLQSNWHLACLPVLAALRELDFHVRFNGESIFSGGTYSDPAISAGYKLYGVIAMTLLITTALRITKRDISPFLLAVRSGHREAWLVTCAMLLLAAAKAIDGLRGRAQDLDWNLPWALFDFAETAEEVLELGAPMVVATAVAVSWRAASGHASDT